MRIYWCEFPETVDWKKLAGWIGNETVSVYLPVKTRKEYDNWKRKIDKISKNIEINAWHVLPFSEGYWHSGFCTKESLDKLDQFKGLKIKIDIEPLKPEGKYTFPMAIKWLIFNLFKKAQNKIYLQEKIKTMSKTSEVVVSTFPIPAFLGQRRKRTIQLYALHHISSTLDDPFVQQLVLQMDYQSQPRCFFCHWLDRYRHFHKRTNVQKH